MALLAGWVLTCIAVAAGQTQGVGLAIFYADFQPYADVVSFYYADVERSLHLEKAAPVPATEYRNAERSPDGEKRVTSLATPGNVDLFVFAGGEDGRQITRASNFPGGSGDRDKRRANLFPAWSPDGEWIAFVSADVVGDLGLFVVRPNGDDLRYVSDQIRVRSALQPRWVAIENSSAEALIVVAVIGIVAGLGVHYRRVHR